MKTNQLELTEVDRAQVAEWARVAPAGYRLEHIDGAVPPDELLVADALVLLVLPPLALEDEELLQAAAARHKASDTDATPAPFLVNRII